MKYITCLIEKYLPWVVKSNVKADWCKHGILHSGHLIFASSNSSVTYGCCVCLLSDTKKRRGRYPLFVKHKKKSSNKLVSVHWNNTTLTNFEALSRQYNSDVCFTVKKKESYVPRSERAPETS